MQPAEYAASRHGAAFAMTRAHANGTTWRVSVFPSSHASHASRAIEAVAGSETQAKRWAERWASRQKELPVRKRA